MIPGFNFGNLQGLTQGLVQTDRQQGSLPRGHRQAVAPPAAQGLIQGRATQTDRQQGLSEGSADRQAAGLVRGLAQAGRASPAATRLPSGAGTQQGTEGGRSKLYLASQDTTEQTHVL